MKVNAKLLTLALCLIMSTWLACNQPETELVVEVEDAPEEPSPAPHKPAVAAHEPPHGIDVSHHSGDVAWSEVVGDGLVFGLAKASEGVDYTDPMFATNWEKMKSARIIRGAYHFYIPDDDPVEQARNFIQNVSLGPGDLPPVVDIEKAGKIKGEVLANQIKQWLDLVEGHFGIKPIIYTTPNFWDANVGGDFSGYHLWISNFGTDTPRLPKAFTQWLIWQYRENVPILGVADGADLSKLNHELIELEAVLFPPVAAAEK